MKISTLSRAERYVITFAWFTLVNIKWENHFLRIHNAHKSSLTCHCQSEWAREPLLLMPVLSLLLLLFFLLWLSPHRPRLLYLYRNSTRHTLLLQSHQLENDFLYSPFYFILFIFFVFIYLLFDDCDASSTRLISCKTWISALVWLLN